MSTAQTVFLVIVALLALPSAIVAWWIVRAWWQGEFEDGEY